MKDCNASSNLQVKIFSNVFLISQKPEKLKHSHASYWFPSGAKKCSIDTSGETPKQLIFFA